MTTRANFLDEPYGAYFHRDVPQPDDELVRVGPGTPCGEYMRRFWHPVAVSDELKDLPKAIRILGEDLVVFRDQSSRVGLLELHCAHRATSLEFGLIEERGIRCCYHGWVFDVDGKILKMPGVEGTLKDRLYQGAYPVIEKWGLVFAYMGPPDKRPEFPDSANFHIPGYQPAIPSVHIWPCNWLQAKDNNVDPAHAAILHVWEIENGVGTGFNPAFADMGVMDWTATPFGMVYIVTRRINDNVWVRLGEFVLPISMHIPTGKENGQKAHDTDFVSGAGWLVPIDDENTLRIDLALIPDNVERFKPGIYGQDGDRPYELRQRIPSDYDAQVSERPIAVHAMERLVSTDKGVIMMRKQLRDGIKAVERGEDPPGIIREGHTIIPTYGSNTVLRIPPASTEEEDQLLLRETGMRVASQIIDQGGSHRLIQES